jgi:hypothetical protein
MQESCRKDVERCFGVLEARFQIVKNPSRLWDSHDMALVMQACIILHNMIVQDERHLHYHHDYEQTNATIGPVTHATATFNTFAESFRSIRDCAAHHALRNDLAEHLWQKKGDDDSVE